MIRFIDEYRDRFPPTLICTTLKNNRRGGFLALRGYRHSITRGLSSRCLRDAVLSEYINSVQQNNYNAYGTQKMWHARRCEGLDNGCEQNCRADAPGGCFRKSQGNLPLASRKPKCPDLRSDLAQREFNAELPDKL